MSWEVKARDGQMGQDGQRDTKPKKEKSTFCFIPRPPRAGRGKRRPKSEHWVRVHYASLPEEGDLAATGRSREDRSQRVGWDWGCSGLG